MDPPPPRLRATRQRTQRTEPEALPSSSTCHNDGGGGGAPPLHSPPPAPVPRVTRSRSSSTRSGLSSGSNNSSLSQPLPSPNPASPPTETSSASSFAKRLVFADTEAPGSPVLLTSTSPPSTPGASHCSPTARMVAAAAATASHNQSLWVDSNAPTVLAPDSRCCPTTIVAASTRASASTRPAAAPPPPSSPLWSSSLSSSQHPVTTLASASSQSAPTLLPTTKSSSASAVVAPASSQSLFGSVMKRVNEHRPPDSEDSYSPDVCPPVADERVVHTSSSPRTPQPAASLDAAKANRNNPFAASPGGFKLLDFLDAVHSPFQHRPPANKRRRRCGSKTRRATNAAAAAEEEEEEEGLQRPACDSDDDDSEDPDDAQSNSHPDDQPGGESKDDHHHADSPWTEAWIDAGSGTLGLVDWVIHQSLHVEHGTMEEPRGNGTSHAPGADRSRRCRGASELELDWRARQRFLQAGRRGSETTGIVDNDECSIRWKAGLLYWQYPSAAAVQVGGMMGGHTNGRNPPLSRQPLQPADGEHGGTVTKREKGQGTLLPTKLTTLRTGVHEQQWQQAFRSLYNSWIHRLRLLAEASGESQPTEKNDLARDDCYFYALGSGYSVLFRAGSSQLSSNARATADVHGGSRLAASCQVRPEILLSASTSALRSQLRDMGVELRLLDDWDDRHGVFDEEWLHPPGSRPSGRPSSSSTPTRPTSVAASSTPARGAASGVLSPALKAELAALRRAQVLGHTVGAAVSVATQAPRRKQRAVAAAAAAAAVRAPALVVSGWDDCSLFAEFLLNSCGGLLREPTRSGSIGQAASGRSAQSPILPLLLCRHLGPFLHASLESLTVKRGTDNTVLVQGTVLPCASRQLMTAAVAALQVSASDSGAFTTVSAAKAMTLPSTAPSTGQRLQSSSLPPNLPTRQVAFHMQVHPGFTAASRVNAGSAALGKIGGQRTSSMNSCVERGDAGAHNQQHPPKRVKCGQWTSDIVWDSTFPDSIVYDVHNDFGGILSSN